MLLTMGLSPNRRPRAAKTDRAWNRKDQSYSGFKFIAFKCWLSWIKWRSSLSFKTFRISPLCYKSFSNTSVAILSLNLWGNPPNSPMNEASAVPHRLPFFSQGRDLPRLGSCFQFLIPLLPQAWFWPCFSESSTAHWFCRQTCSHSTVTGWAQGTERLYMTTRGFVPCCAKHVSNHANYSNSLLRNHATLNWWVKSRERPGRMHEVAR